MQSGVSFSRRAILDLPSRVQSTRGPSKGLPVASEEVLAAVRGFVRWAQTSLRARQRLVQGPARTLAAVRDSVNGVQRNLCAGLETLGGVPRKLRDRQDFLVRSENLRPLS